MIIETKVPVLTVGERVVSGQYFGFRTPVRPPVLKSVVSQSAAVAAPMFSASNADPSAVVEAEKVVAFLRNRQNLRHEPTVKTMKAEQHIKPAEKRKLIREEAVRASASQDCPINFQYSLGRSYRVQLTVNEFYRLLISRENRDYYYHEKTQRGSKPHARLRGSLTDIQFDEWIRQSIEDYLDTDEIIVD